MTTIRRRRWGTGDIGRIQMAPMIDVVFQLLIFFLVTSEVAPTEADFHANLPDPGPQPRPVTKVPKEVYRVFLREVEDGRTVEVSINRAVLGRGAEAFRLLTERLSRMPAPDDALLVIDGEPRVRMQCLAQTLDAATEAQIRNLAFPRGGGF